MSEQLRQIQLDAPDIGVQERLRLEKAMSSGYISTAGPFVPEFEEKFLARITGAKAAVSTQSGTAALHMALYELGIGPGDEVIVPVLTFVATVNPIKYVGAKPVFVDVDIDTWNIDLERIEEKITEKTKAIIPVHLYGNPCNIDGIIRLAKKHNLFVIEDATESLDAKYKDRYTGTFGDLGCFSFNGNKIITTGGGGMIVGRSIEHINHIKFLINQARDETKSYYHSEIGFNYRMTNLEAALGLAQLERLEEFINKKKIFNNIYRNELGALADIKFQKEYPDAKSCFWLTCITVESDIDIMAVQRILQSKGVPVRRIFMPLIEFPPYREYKDRDYSNARYIYERGLCLPSSVLNSEDDIRKVSKALKACLIKE